MKKSAKMDTLASPVVWRMFLLRCLSATGALRIPIESGNVAGNCLTHQESPLRGS
ncbi:MAG: hypothetical protein OXB95_01615 [Rhodobacteraceae bacterium]|nr:hypothetical protein [Paracoccaceae bacterium]